MKFVLLFEGWAAGEDLHIQFKPGPLGTRGIGSFNRGSFEGPRMKGRYVWGCENGFIDAKGVFHIDVRHVLQTDDGAFIYGQLNGIWIMNEAAKATGAPRTETAYEEDYFNMTARYETGDARYEWLNNIVVVGQARFLPGAIGFRCYEMQNG